MKGIAQYIQKHQLFEPENRIIVAVSGGADSIALLHILLQLGYTCEVAHCNFHLRGAESDRDETFVQQVCRDWGVRLHVQHFETTTYAAEHGISIEMAARELRYDWFETLRKERGASVIAVAHHQNDQAETVLLNLQRGTGFRGLEGMHPKNGAIVRPLLGVSRDFIEDYCTLHHLGFVTDSTNTDTTFLRNAIRKRLEVYSPAQIAHIAQTAEHMQGYEQLIRSYVAEKRESIVRENRDGIEIDAKQLLALPAPEIMLYELLREYGFKQIEQIFTALQGEAGRKFYSETHEIEVGRESLSVFPIKRKERFVSIVEMETVSVPITYPATEAWEAIFNGSIAEKKLTLRHWQEGDWFIPLGMKGKKKLQDFFTDMKLSRHEKEQVWLLCADEDIAWVIGYRIDERYKVKAPKKAVRIRCRKYD